jgi:hypothetical protein
MRGADGAEPALYRVAPPFVRTRVQGTRRRVAPAEKITAGGANPAGRGIVPLVQGPGAAYFR